MDHNDLIAIAAVVGQAAPSRMAPLLVDVNGHGSVSALDLTLAARFKGRELKSGLPRGEMTQHQDPPGDRLGG